MLIIKSWYLTEGFQLPDLLRAPFFFLRLFLEESHFEYYKEPFAVENWAMVAPKFSIHNTVLEAVILLKVSYSALLFKELARSLNISWRNFLQVLFSFPRTWKKKIIGLFQLIDKMPSYLFSVLYNTFLLSCVQVSIIFLTRCLEPGVDTYFVWRAA